MSERQPTFWSRAVLLSACLLASACSTPGNSETSSTRKDDKSAMACASNEDCPGSMVCGPSLGLAIAAPQPVPMAEPPPPCSFDACGENLDCPEDLICVSATQALGGTVFPGSCPETVCDHPCDSDQSCPSGEVCRETGLCEVKRCEEADGPPCPQDYACDPPDPRARPDGCRRIRCDEDDGPACAEGRICEPEAQNSDVVGCRVLTCEEPGALECNALVSGAGNGSWTCDPALAPEAYGCVPVPCGMPGGGCYSDDYVCAPTSSAGRAEGTDAYGCVRRNCEEGLECFSPLNLPDADGQITQEPINIGYCDYDGPNADPNGCAQRHCSELERGCRGGHTCDPDSPNADARGCRQLRCDEPDGYGCGGSVCDPDHPRALALGCRPQMCDDLPDYQCPEGTECNSRGTNANSMGCAPPGDVELVPLTPTATADATQPPPPPGPESTTPLTPDPSSPDNPSGPDPSSPDTGAQPAPAPNPDATSTDPVASTRAKGDGSALRGVCVDGP